MDERTPENKEGTNPTPKVGPLDTSRVRRPTQPVTKEHADSKPETK